MDTNDVNNPGTNVFFPRIRDPQFRDLYINGSLTRITPFDITLIFTKSVELTPAQVIQSDQVAVIMSPQLCKSLAKSLADTIIAYETAYGKLQIPDADIAGMFTTDQIVDQITASRAQVAEMREKAQSAPTSSTEPPPLSKRSHSASPKKER